MQAILRHGHEFFFGVYDPTGWWISEKYDGVRAVWNKTHFISKNGIRRRERGKGGRREEGKRQFSRGG